jgi:hypothetical protein
VDKLFIKGVKFNREENDCNLDYLYVDTHENLGIRFYLHRYFVGYHSYYLQRLNEDVFNKIKEIPNDKKEIPDILKEQDLVRDTFFKQRKFMLERSLSKVLRVTLVARDYGKLESTSGPESLYDPAYTGNHIVMFEC